MRAGLPTVLFSALAALGALAGCSHYEWGTQGRLQFATLYIAPVRNRTLLPQVVEPVETQLRTAFLRDGRVEVVDSPAAADAVLQVVIVGFGRQVAAPRRQDTGLASAFVETFTTQCTLVDRRDGRAYFENRPVAVNRSVYTDNGNPNASLVGDQLQAEYNTVPLMAERLSNAIAHTVLDVW